MSDTRDLIERVEKNKTAPVRVNGMVLAERLAAVCEVLLAAHPERECACAENHSLPPWRKPICYFGENDCGRGRDEPCICQPCRDRALMERCDTAARGEA